MAVPLRRLLRLFPPRIGGTFLLPLLGVCLSATACQDSGNNAGSSPQMAEMEIGSLRFNADGIFKIVQFTDTQDDQEIDPRTVRLVTYSDG